MFRQVSTGVVVALVAVGIVAGVIAEEPKQAVGKTKDPPKEVTVDLGGVKLDLVLIPAGELKMGSPGDNEYEKQHRVRITKPFYLGKYLVTQEQWEAVTDDARSNFVGRNNPVERVSWEDCQTFLRNLNAMTGGKAGKFVLPTEAQWEYACRAGSTTKYYFGDDDKQLGEYAWYAANSGSSTHPVGKKKPNAWGLYDMQGNVSEWCQDWFDMRYYAKSPIDNPTGPTTPPTQDPALPFKGPFRVVRGGGFGNVNPIALRSAARSFGTPGDREVYLGVRVALIPVGNILPAAEPTPATPKQITNSIAMKLTLVPSGEFMMGSKESAEETAAFFNKVYGMDLKADDLTDEHPQHRVRITKPIYLGTYHVTRGQFGKFVADTGYKTDAEKNIGEFKGGDGWDPAKKEFAFSEEYSWRNAGFKQTDEHPVVNVSWNDAVAFCKWLSRKEDKTYRLPTEAEWEYACRAGTTTRYYNGDDPEMLAKIGNVADATYKATFPDFKYTIKASDGYAFTAPVGSFQPNAFGLYDMQGNAGQWCSDWYDARYYAGSPTEDPPGPKTGLDHVFRVSSWCSPAWACRSACRESVPWGWDMWLGFRVARIPVEK